MSDETRSDRADLPTAALDRLDRICDRFKAALAGEARPRIEDYLGGDDPYRSALLRDLLASELDARRCRGERPEPSEYRGRFQVPGDSAVIAAAFAATPIRPAVDPPGSELADVTGEVGGRDRPTVPAPDHGEATHDPVDPGGVTLAGDPLTHGGSSSPSGDQAGTEAGRTAADLAPEVASADSVVATSDGHAPPAAPRGPHPTLPGYEILGELGRGGMGVVYKARQVRLNRAAALKMILAGQHAGAESAARFLGEAAAVAKLQHPNIVQIFHIDEHAGFPYFEMEFVGGGSLAARLDGTPRPPRQAARLVETLAGAMAEAHRQGVVHRDLKPGNILLTPDGVPKVADFGLAKLLNVESGLTRTDSILGSPSYMAPEQAEGKTKDVGPAADIYALGAILYELLTGRPPFRGATVLETLEQVKTAEPVPPSRLVPGLPRDAETIALKCLQKDPAKRYESATALAEDLRRYQAGEPIVARPVGPAERAWRWCRRNPALAALAAAVVTLLVAVALGATLSAFRFRALSQALESNLYFSDIALADRELLADNLGRARKLLDDCPPGLRQWEWYYIERRCRVEPVILRAPAGIYGVALSPDGEQIAAAGADGTVQVLDTRTGKVVKTLSGHRQLVFSVGFSPDGHHVASASEDRTIRLWDLDRATDHEEVFCRGGHTGGFVRFAHCLAFSPDGRHLVAGSEDGGAIVWDAADGSEVRRLPGHEKAVSCAAFSPDGRLLATGITTGVVRIWDAPNGQLLHTVRAHADERVSAIVFSRDGRWLATTGMDRTTKVWDVTTGALLQTLSGHAGLITGLAFSPDGRRLATSEAEEKTVKIWDPLTGREILNLRGHTDMCTCVVFSRDGRRLVSASSDRTIRVWDASPVTGNEGLESLNLDLHEEVWSVAFSPDGGSLAAASYTTVRLLDAQTGAPLRTYADHVAVARVVFSPDGRQLATVLDPGEGIAIGKVWDVATGGEAVTIREKNRAFSVAFDPDGRYLLREGPGHTVKVWDARTGLALGEIGRHDNLIWAMTFSPDGRRLATASNDGTVRVWTWDPARPGEMQEPELKLSTIVMGFGDRVAFSPDGRHLAAGGEEHTIKVWDARTGAEQQTLRGHTGDVFAVAFDRQGRWLASAGEDTTVRLWDTTSSPWRLRHKLRGHIGLVMSLAFSRDGRRLVSGSRDGTAKVWDLTRLGKRPEE
jgi:WD40 repeat protein/tRNA A-37 threonylcarbamoyl transferase component Bud32